MLFSVPSFTIGFASGFGAGFFTREFVRVGRGTLRPSIKSVIKTAIMAVEKARESIAVASETFDDLVAEARTELARGGEAGTPGKSGRKTRVVATSGSPDELTQGGAEAAAAGNEPKHTARGR